MAAAKSKKKAGDGDKEGEPGLAPTVVAAASADDDNTGDDTSHVERQYYWRQLLEFKVVPRIRRGARAGVGVHRDAPKTTADSVRVVVRALGKGKGRPRKRCGTPASSSSPPPAPPGSSGKRRGGRA